MNLTSCAGGAARAVFGLRWLIVFLGATGGAGPAWADTGGTPWVEHFVERFESPAGDRFKMLPLPFPGRTSSGGTLDHDAAGHAMIIGGWLQLVRPFKAGPQVRLELELAFQPDQATNTASAGEAPLPPRTVFSLVLFNQSTVRVVVQPGTNGASGGSRLRLESLSPGMTTGRLVAEADLGRGTLDGSWVVEYRHGLVEVRRGGRRLITGDFGTLGVQVAGVAWEQRGGKVRCSGMKVSGLPLRALTAEEGATLTEAARLNEEAQRLAREGGKGEKAKEAVPKMREALALFAKVHGEEHLDVGNANANLAAMLDLAGGAEASAEAGRLFAKALGIHERALGEGHPHTTLTRFNLGRHLLDAGKPGEARTVWERCRADWKAVHGAEYPLVKSLDEILQGL